jgi:type IV pilus assembly protein PilX
MIHPSAKLGADRLRGQRGAALIVALILLLVMTLLGITAMNSSILQGFMSASYQEQTVRLAAAENILLTGEFDVEDLVANGVVDRGTAPNQYYFNLDTDPALQFAAAAAATPWPNGFVIEYMGNVEIPGESIAVGGALEDSSIHIFRVSARSERDASERGGLRIVQSLYVTLRGPDQ